MEDNAMNLEPSASVGFYGIAPSKFTGWQPTDLITYKPIWEYYFLMYSDTAIMNGSHASELFNQLGAVGWELVTTDILQEQRWGTEWRAIFKRIKE